MSSVPCLVKTMQKSKSLKLMGQSHLVLVCLIRDMGLTKHVQVMVLGLILTFVKPNIKVIYILVTQCLVSALRPMVLGFSTCELSQFFGTSYSVMSLYFVRKTPPTVFSNRLKRCRCFLL